MKFVKEIKCEYLVQALQRDFNKLEKDIQKRKPL